MDVKPFGVLADGRQTRLYTISQGAMKAAISDFGATLVSLWVPDREGTPADVVLGFEDANHYIESGAFLGATVGRCANRIGGAEFTLNGTTYSMERNDNENNCHSGSDSYAFCLWEVAEYTPSSITFCLDSPNGHQGFPGNASIRVTYALDAPGTLRITYDGICDRDTVFNMTNHSYFNLAGHDKGTMAMEQILSLNADVFTVADAMSLPTGEMRSVEGTPMDFRTPEAIGRDIDTAYEPLKLQNGYDHNFAVKANPCAVLLDPASGRTMQVYTDCPGVQLYTGNFLNGAEGKNGTSYCRRSGICLETQYYPDALHHPQWEQPVVKAGEPYHSQTLFVFK